jgi:hypothetical protein
MAARGCAVADDNDRVRLGDLKIACLMLDIFAETGIHARALAQDSTSG